MLYCILLIVVAILCFLSKEGFSGTKIINIKKIFRTPTERKKGLMFKKNIDPDIGYMFYYKKPKIASFWMKNTYIPLDIIFIDKTKRIVHMIEGMAPHDLTLKGYHKKVNYVIEIKGGFIKKNQLKKGQKIKFNYHSYL